MERETRVIREIDHAKGTVTDRAGQTVFVRFSLRQTQAIINGIPSLRSASGSLEFDDARDAESMFESAPTKTLRDAGIEVEVILDTMRSLIVTGPIKDI